MSDGRVEQSWYGELYAIHKLKVACTKHMLQCTSENRTELQAALNECYKLGLTDEILLERLKI